jgi:hypothetical protein
MRFLVTEKLGPHKFKTPEGYLICTDAILSRTGKQEYKRCELFGDACEDPDKIVNVERTDDEVFSDKAMASFENKPVCIEHPDEDVNVENHNDLSVGFVRDIHKGEDNGKPVMMGTLVITDKNAVEAVESGEYKELSCGYDCDIDDDAELCQRNIRGNHVALCKQGRAGIARIVDSVDDAEEDDIKYGYKDRMAGVYDKWYRYNRKDGGRSYDLGQKLAAKEKNAPEDVHFIEVMHDMAVMRFDFSTNIAAFERAIINNDVAEFNSMLTTFEKDIIDYETWKKEGRLSAADIGKVKRQIDKINSLLAKSKINKKFEVKDMATLIDTDFSKQTKQGYQVLEMYRDGGRLHVIFKRANDFGIGLGYDTTDGQWAQGRYDFSTLEKARKALMEEKPYARRIQDSVNDDNWSSVEEENYKKANKPVGAKDVTEKNFKIYVKNAFGAYKVADWPAVSKEAAVKEFLEMNPAYRNKGIIEARDSVSDSKKEQLFTIEYKQDDVTYIRKVRANSIEDAISKVKDDAHKVVVFANQVLNELGKNNSIGKYDRVVQAMRSLYSESLLPDNKLKELIRKKVPEYIKKYVKE